MEISLVDLISNLKFKFQRNNFIISRYRLFLIFEIFIFILRLSTDVDLSNNKVHLLARLKVRANLFLYG